MRALIPSLRTLGWLFSLWPTLLLLLLYALSFLVWLDVGRWPTTFPLFLSHSGPIASSYEWLFTTAYLLAIFLICIPIFLLVILASKEVTFSLKKWFFLASATSWLLLALEPTHRFFAFFVTPMLSD